MEGFIFNIKDMTPAQIKCAYEHEIIQIIEELNRLQNLLDGIPIDCHLTDQQIREINNMQSVLDAKLNDVRAEYTLAKIYT